MPDSRYSLRPIRRDVLPMLADWLKTPELRRWWGDPTEQAGFHDVAIRPGEDD